VGESEREEGDGGEESLAQTGECVQRRARELVHAAQDLHVVDDAAVLLRHALELDGGGGAGAVVDEALPRPGAVAQRVRHVVHRVVDHPVAHGGALQRRHAQRGPQVDGPVGRAAHVVLHRVRLAAGGGRGQRGGQRALRAVGGRRGVEVDAEYALHRGRARAVGGALQDLHAGAARRPVHDGGAGGVGVDGGVARDVGELEVAVDERDHAALRGRGRRRGRAVGEGVDAVLPVELPPGLGLHQIGVHVTRAAGRAHPAQRPHERHNAEQRRHRCPRSQNLAIMAHASAFHNTRSAFYTKDPLYVCIHSTFSESFVFVVLLVFTVSA
jgi:hypothetical protein